MSRGDDRSGHVTATDGPAIRGAASTPAVAAALGATAVESVLSVWLLSGWRRRAAGVVAAGLLCVLLASMLPTVGAAKVAMNAVPLLVGGALLLAAQPVDSDLRYCAGRSSHTVA